MARDRPYVVRMTTCYKCRGPVVAMLKNQTYPVDGVTFIVALPIEYCAPCDSGTFAGVDLDRMHASVMRFAALRKINRPTLRRTMRKMLRARDIDEFDELAPRVLAATDGRTDLFAVRLA